MIVNCWFRKKPIATISPTCTWWPAHHYRLRRSQLVFIKLVSKLVVASEKPFFNSTNDLFIDMKNTWGLDDQHAASGLKIGVNPSNLFNINADDKAVLPKGANRCVTLALVTQTSSVKSRSANP